MTHLLKQYIVITGTYWAFTITDGALRMLVVLYFYNLGYSAFAIAMLFLFYEVFGVVTNLVGGWLGSKLGLNKTMNMGVMLQIVALAMLAANEAWLTVPYVMTAQALSGIAKDLNKMSAKSAIKYLMPAQHQQGNLYRWVALLTGSKNSLKGVGFFIGAMLLSLIGFRYAMILMMVALILVLVLSLILLSSEIGKASTQPKFKQLFSKSSAINCLSAARLFLFGARDVWFVVALPVYFQATLMWSNTQVGAFMALWIIGYGVIQGIAPLITGLSKGKIPNGKTARSWAIILALIPALIALSLMQTTAAISEVILVAGLMLFGIVFAINSAVHSFLILAYAKTDGVSLDVGFYYMANAMGRLIGTVSSGAIFQWQGLEACLLVSSFFLLLTVMISFLLPSTSSTTAKLKT